MKTCNECERKGITCAMWGAKVARKNFDAEKCPIFVPKTLTRLDFLRIASPEEAARFLSDEFLKGFGREEMKAWLAQPKT